MREFLQSTARNLSVWIALSSDHITGATGLATSLAAALNISQNGGVPATMTATVTEIGHGWYNIALTTSHTSVLGDLVIYATVATTDGLDVRGEVIAVNFRDAVRGGMTALPNANASAAGGLIAIGTGAGQLNLDGAGAADANGVKWRGTAVAVPTVAGIPKAEASGGTVATTQVIASVTGAVGSVGTGGITSATFATGAITGAAMAASAITAIWQYIIENGATVENYFRQMAAVLTGVGTGLEGAAPTYRDNTNTKNRVVFTYSSGARGVSSRDGT